jgi:hypothetical protein
VETGLFFLPFTSADNQSSILSLDSKEESDVVRNGPLWRHKEKEKTKQKQKQIPYFQ